MTLYEYDLVGNLKKVTKPKGTIIQYTYDGQNRLATVTYPDSSTVTMTYDPNGNRTQMVDSLGTQTWAYDTIDRLTSHTDTFGNVVGYAYDDMGNRKSMTYPGNKTVNYAYDALNRMKSVTDWLNHVTEYSYDSASRLTLTLNGNATKALYGYDNANRLTSLANQKADASVISSYAYTLDPVGNQTSETRNEPLAPNFTPGTTVYTHDNENRLTNAGGVGNSFDLNGNLLTKGTTTFGYDFEDRLVQRNVNGTAFQYVSDGLGHRRQRTESGNATRFVLDSSGDLSQVLTETGVTNVVTAYYVYGLGLISRIAADSTVKYYHYDFRGSTVALTDAAGSVAGSYAYGPYGEIVANSGGTENLFRFLGRHGVLDETAGLLFIRARYYDAGSGRFIAKDPKPGSTPSSALNLYIYALDNPVRLVDVSGYSSREGWVDGVRDRLKSYPLDTAVQVAATSFFSKVFGVVSSDAEILASLYVGGAKEVLSRYSTSEIAAGYRDLFTDPAGLALFVWQNPDALIGAASEATTSLSAVLLNTVATFYINSGLSHAIGANPAEAFGGAQGRRVARQIGENVGGDIVQVGTGGFTGAGVQNVTDKAGTWLYNQIPWAFDWAVSR
jgi:RHS repeat-associated protein